MGVPFVALKRALFPVLFSVAWISTGGAAFAFQSCNGLSGTITPNFLTLNDGLRGTSGQFNVADGDVISGTVSGLDPNITASARLAQPGLTTRRVFFTNGVGGAFSFTINVAAREASFGQQVAELFLYANAGATATFNCVGTSNQPADDDDDSSGDDSSSSDNTGTPGQDVAAWTGASDSYTIGQFNDNDADDWTSIDEAGGGLAETSAGDTGRTYGGYESGHGSILQEEIARLNRERERLVRKKWDNDRRLRGINRQVFSLVFQSAKLLSKDVSDFTGSIGTLSGMFQLLGSMITLGLIPDPQQQAHAANAALRQEMKAIEHDVKLLEELVASVESENAYFEQKIAEIDAHLAAIEEGSAANYYFTEDRRSDHGAPPFGWLPAAKKQPRLPFYLNAISPDENTDIANFSARFGDEHLYGWIGGNYTWTRDRRTGNNTDRHAVRVEAGLLYKYSSVVDLGGKVRLTYGSSARLDGTSTTGALAVGASTFARIKLPQGIVLTPVIAYERSSTDISFNSGAATGNFATDIFMVGAKLSKRFRPSFATLLNQAYIEPNMSLSLMHGIRHGYTLSNNTVIAGASFWQGTLRFGPTIGWRSVEAGETFASVDHTVSLNGTWNFLRPTSFTSASGAQVSTPTFSASINAALSAKTYKGKTLSLGIGYSGIGSKVQSALVSGSIRIPLN